MEKINRALLLAPHPDDGEFGCGGTLKKLTENGVEVFYAAFSPCIKSLPAGMPEDMLFSELKVATGHLGIDTKNVITFDFPVRDLPQFRQSILEDLIVLRKDIRPDLVLLPNSDDVHQDHHTIYEEGVRAFKHSKLIGYELPWNNLKFTGNFHVKLERHHLKAKVQAVNEYKSQNFRKYKDEEFLFGLAQMRGVQVNAEFAEAFELIRWMI